MGDWCTIESDPGVFTELIAKIGVKDVQVEELVSLDSETMSPLKPVFGLIFLFKYVKDPTDTNKGERAEGVFFAKQVITNACATQAIISVLMNRKELEVGDALSNFREFAGALPPDMCGLAISNMDSIRKAHNSFRRPEPFVMESKVATEDDDVYHFVGYVPVDGKLYELDGLREGPVLHGDCGDDWLAKAATIIQARIGKYAAKEIRFNLLALVKDRITVIDDKQKVLKAKAEAIEAKLAGEGGGGETSMDTTEGEESLSGKSDDELKAAKLGVEDEVKQLKTDRATEVSKREGWAEENTRRKHNYVPLIFALLQGLAAKGKLESLQEEAKKVGAVRIERRQKAAAKAQTAGK